jgi:chromosome partitioning protein
MDRGLIIGIIGKKGGTGKSTISENLAVAFRVGEGAKVAALDADVNQRTLSKWIARRNDAIDGGEKLPKINCFIQTESVKESALELARSHDVVIIDVAGADSRAMRQSLIVSDIVYLPLTPDQNSLETFDDVYDLIVETTDICPNRIVKTLLVKTPTHPSSSDKREAQKLLEEYKANAPLSKAYIPYRIIYQQAAPLGKGVMELNNEKAKYEFKKLVKEILSYV